ncbi:uncharacterized protein PgNI_09736 [Pyricularia grisea]|uniref:AAA+ ATPase domain-containing protein n=1 Tax=Pyricularia grisea TaxID=148305 RepID=A0A6P8ARB0_PYRGI|nr:uncharacterized protein PgNI_09736 [Pyricularia grisea]TLD04640.1 hypothetical protein PgNI_09736 [Pyricularia grisea]
MHRAGSRAISARAVSGSRAPGLGLGRNLGLSAACRHASNTTQRCTRLQYPSDSLVHRKWSRLYSSSSPAAAAASPDTPNPPQEPQPPMQPPDEPNAPFSAQDVSQSPLQSSRRSQRRGLRTTTSYPPVDLPTWFLENYVTLRGEGLGYPDDYTTSLQLDPMFMRLVEEREKLKKLQNKEDDSRLEEYVANFKKAADAIQSHQPSELSLLQNIRMAEEMGELVVLAGYETYNLAQDRDMQRMVQEKREHERASNKMRLLKNLQDRTHRSLTRHAQTYLLQDGIDLEDDGFKTAVAAELTAAASLASKTLPAGSRRPVPVLQIERSAGAPLARAVVEKAALQKGADVIHLDAHVLAEIIGKYLGQDPYMNKGPYTMLGLNVETINSRVMLTPAGSSLPPVGGNDGDSGVDPTAGTESVVVGPEAFKTLRRLFHGDSDSKPDGNRWDDLKLGHILEQILNAPEIKRSTTSLPSRDETRPSVVHLHNFKELLKIKEGSFIVSKLRATVDRLLREQGKHIVLVGSTIPRSGRVTPTDFGKMVMHASSDLEIHEYLFAPLIPEEVQRRVSADTMKQINLTNLAVLMEAMLGEEVTFRLNHQMMAVSENPANFERTILGHTMLYRLATWLISRQGGGQPKKVYEQDDLYAELSEWQQNFDNDFRRNFGHLQGGKDPKNSNGVESSSLGGDTTKLGALRGLFEVHGADEGQGNEEYDRYEEQLLTGLVRAEDIKTTWEDVVCSPETKESIQAMTSLVLTRPQAFSYGVLAKERMQGCLLYGPPGTGKTLMAKAVARQSGANVLEISAASINDKYHGESEKRVRAVFSLAKKMSPAVIFLDEADALLGSRSHSTGRGGFRETLNQFLKEWDGLTEMKTFVMVATNRPFDLDDAVLRRMPRRVLVDLPLKEARLNMLQVLLRDERLDGSVNLEDISARTEMCSGSDIKNICVAAAMEAVKDEIKARDNSTDPDSHVFPDHRTLTADHFERALKQISASISGDMDSLKAIRKFDERFGDAQGRGSQKARNTVGFAVGAVPSRSGDARVRRIDSA